MKKLTALLVVLLAACGPDPVFKEAGDWQYFDIGNTTISVAEITLDSGRECVVTFEQGIWCESTPR